VSTAERTEDLLRALAPRVLGAVGRRYGDFADAEDAVQEALVAAMQTWPVEGRPDNPLGWLIRAAGLDELPQIINVLKGDMSLIGPRPCIPYEYDNYSVSQRARFNSRPGLTGLWQVSGKNRTTFDRMIQLDIQYSMQRSLKMDLKILFLTVPAMLSQVHDMCRARWADTIQTNSSPVGGESKPLEVNKHHASVRVS